MDARRGESVDIHPSASTRMTTSPSRPGPAPEGGLVHFAAQVGGALRRTRSDGLGFWSVARRCR